MDPEETSAAAEAMLQRARDEDAKAKVELTPERKQMRYGRARAFRNLAHDLRELG